MQAAKSNTAENYHKLAQYMQGAAEQAGFKSEQELIDYCKMIRRELNARRRAGNARND